MKRIGIVGGGLAGLAAAERLLRDLPDDWQIHLFERSRFLGGRAAAAWSIPARQKTLDAAQHLTMGCCPHFLDFLERTGLREYWKTQDCMAFFHQPRNAKHGRFSLLRNSRILPPPFHLLGSLLRMRFLTLTERLNLARTLRRFLLDSEPPQYVSLEDWLVQHRCVPRVRRLFFDMVAVSAFCDLAEDVPARLAQRVFREMFRSGKTAWQPILPTEPLRAIFNERLEPFLAQPLAQKRLWIHRGTGIARVELEANTHVRLVRAGSDDTPQPDADAVHHPQAPTRANVRSQLESWDCSAENGFSPTADAEMETAMAVPEEPTPVEAALDSEPVDAEAVPSRFDACVLAVPWHTAGKVVPELLSQRVVLEAFFEPRTIAAVHFWTTKPLFPVENLALPGSLIQWIFRHGFGNTADGGVYHQALLSNSDECVTSDPHALRQLVLDEIQTLFPQAEILDAHVVRFPGAVFSSQPEFSGSNRPGARTPWPRLFLAGDWTDTGLPGTMEGAVRSGRNAAQALLESLANTEP